MSPAFKAAYHAELNRRMSTPEGRKEQREAMARMMASMKAAKAFLREHREVIDEAAKASK
jgi:hypothetical protein